MKFIKNTTWEEVFNGWRDRESANPNWIDCATKVKGWPDWELWRQFTANQMSADKRDWQIFEIENPAEEIPKMLVGPYSGWQSRLPNKNMSSFEDLLNIPEQYNHFSQYTSVLSILNGLPFSTEFIGLIREDTNQIVCIEGHHRAVAMTLAKKQNKLIDFSKTKITIALAILPKDDCDLFDKMLARGTSKDTQPN